MQLFHNPMSTCSQKVRLVLAEKALDFDSQILDLQAGAQFDDAYLALNPQAVVPTLVDAGQPLVESTLINEYLEESYPKPQLMPASAKGRHQVRLITMRLDEVLHRACGIVTYAIGIRPGLLRRSQADIDALIAGIPDPIKRADRAQVLSKGIDADNFGAALSAYLGILDEAENHLSQHDFLAGSDVTLADFGLLPYLLRLEHLALIAAIDARPRLANWYQNMQRRPSFATAVTSWLPTSAVDAFQAAGNAIKPKLDLLIQHDHSDR